MTRLLVVAFLCSACLPSSVAGLQWTSSSTDGQTLTACVGSDVTFPWDFVKDQGDVIVSINWVFQGPTLMAFYSRGTFLSVPDYQGRVQHGANGELTLSHVALNDSGRYTVEVNGHSASGSSFSLTRNIYVNVHVSAASDQQLHVTSSPRAVHDDVTGRWSLQLSCGDFTDMGQLAFTAEWTTPSGRTYNSTSFSDGQFHLLLPSPPQPGAYTCHIPDQYISVGCLPADSTTVTLDSTDIRLTLLEAEQDSLRSHNLLLKEENVVLKQRLSDLENSGNASSLAACPDSVKNLTELVSNQTRSFQVLLQTVDKHSKDVVNLTSVVETLTQDGLYKGEELEAVRTDLGRLQNSSRKASISLSSLVTELHLLETIHLHDNAEVTQEISSLKALLNSPSRSDAAQMVTFHAQLDANVGAGFGQPLVLTAVYNNNGQAYNRTTGIFTAPRDGTYFFIATTGSYNATQSAYLEIVADGQQLATAFAHSNSQAGEMATCHAVADLTAGQQVWLRAMQDSFFNYADTFFSGFLISLA